MAASRSIGLLRPLMAVDHLGSHQPLELDSHATRVSIGPAPCHSGHCSAWNQALGSFACHTPEARFRWEGL